jgi:hypothetical protein
MGKLLMLKSEVRLSLLRYIDVIAALHRSTSTMRISARYLLLLVILGTVSFVHAQSSSSAKLQRGTTQHISIGSRAGVDGVLTYTDTWFSTDPSYPWNGTNITYSITKVAPEGEAVYTSVEPSIGTCTILTNTSFNCNFGAEIPGSIIAYLTVNIEYTPEADWVEETVSDHDYTYPPYPRIINPYALGTEQLVNGGFEVAALSEKEPDNWSVSNFDGDKRVCNKDTKIVAYLGECALQLKGDPSNSKTKLTQKITPAIGQAGDALWVGLWASAKKAPEETYVGLKYGTAAEPKVKAWFVIPEGTYNWQWITGQIGLDSPLTELKVEIYHKATTGKVWLDAVGVVSVDIQ